MTKNAVRGEKFKKIGAAISKIGDPNVSDYETGLPSQFELAVVAIEDKSTDSKYEPCMGPCCAMLTRKDGGINSHFPGAPLTRTWQLERTVAKG